VGAALAAILRPAIPVGAALAAILWPAIPVGAALAAILRPPIPVGAALAAIRLQESACLTHPGACLNIARFRLPSRRLQILN